MFEVMILDTAAKSFRESIPVAEISDYCASSRHVVWVYVNDPTGMDFLSLAEEFGFHPLSIEDCRSGHQRPKIEDYPGYYFLVLYEAELAGPHDRLELRELNIFLGPNYLVTVHRRPVRAIATAKRLWRGWADRRYEGAGLPAYLLFDAVVDDYMPLLDLLTERTDDLIEEIFADLRPEIMQEIFFVKRQFLHLRRAMTPLRDVFNVILRREQPVFDRSTHLYLQDVFDNLLRVGDMVDALRETLQSAMDAYLSVSGNRMNMVMKRLTSLSAILMSVTLIAGIYGMNFQFMPELGWRYGYIFALLSMVGIGSALYVYLKKIKWL